MNNEKISVIIPVYNTAAYLEKCLLSVQCQSYPLFECLIVDDGSTDLSPDIALRFAAKDDRFRLIRQAHAGVAEAICSGVNQASGKWLYFLDSDDWIDPDELQHLYTLVTDHRCDMIASNYIVEADHPQTHSIVRFCGAVEKESFPGLFYHQLLCNDRYSGIVCGNTRGGKLVKRSLAQQNLHLQESMVFAEDAMLMLGILFDCSRVYGAPDHAGYHYRMHLDSSMHTYGFAYAAHRADYARRLRLLFAEKAIAGDPAVEQNYSRFRLYCILGTLHSIGFDVNTLKQQDPQTYAWVEQTSRALSQMDKRILGKRNRLLLWMLNCRMFSLLSLLYAWNHYLRCALNLSK